MKVYIVFSLLILTSTVDVEAGWKFWKKSNKDEQSTTSTTTTTTPTPIVANPTPTPGTINVHQGIASAGNPGLAIGVGSTGSNIRNNAQPQKPNPGTEVGLDIPSGQQSRPGVGSNTNSQGYRDWAVSLTGAGEPGKQPPKLPAQGPAYQPESPQNQPRPVQGQSNILPTPGTAPQNKPQSQPTPVPRPVTSSTNAPSNNNNNHNPQVSTLHVGPLTPGSRPNSPTGNSGPGSNYPSLPGSTSSQGGAITPNSSPGNAPPSNRPSYANVASSGSRPNSPTSTTRTGPSVINQPTTARPTQGGQQTGPSATNTGGKKVYSSNPTYSKGNTVTDEDLEKLSEALFIKDTNNANRYITLNLQKKTTSNSPTDEAPQPLLQVNPEALQIPTIQRVLSIYDNYNLDTRTNEYISPAQRQEESLLVDTFLSTNVMSAAMRFLADKGFVRKDYYEYKDTLRRLWFNLYSRGEGKIGSSGFEHVFLTEVKLGTEVSGLHNWIYFNAEEVKRRANYLGYIKKVDLGDKAAIVKIHAQFNNIDKPTTTLFIGTSPELEMALYTVCFFARPEQSCPVSLGGTKFNIITHKFKYRGKELIGSAYPEI